jgi:hypothetical protein
MSGALVQNLAVALVLLGAVGYLARRIARRISAARRPQSGRCGSNCGCGDADY